MRYWANIFEKVYRGKIDTWDYQWHFTCLINNGLAIMPNVNLISNIGFDAQATHTSTQSMFSRIAIEPMEFGLSHPPFIVRNIPADQFTEQIMFSIPLFNKIMHKFKGYIR
jgi:hypothetical protein